MGPCGPGPCGSPWALVGPSGRLWASPGPSWAHLEYFIIEQQPNALQFATRNEQFVWDLFSGFVGKLPRKPTCLIIKV